MTALNFNPTSEVEFSSASHFNCRSPFDHTDLLELSVVVKHMNIVELVSIFFVSRLLTAILGARIHFENKGAHAQRQNR